MNVIVTLHRRMADKPGEAVAPLTTADLPGTFDALATKALLRLRSVTPVLVPYHAYEVIPGPAYDQMPPGEWPRDTR